MTKEMQTSYGSKINAMLPKNRSRIKELIAKKKNKMEESEASTEEKVEFLEKLATDKKVREAYAERLAEETTLGIEAQFIATDFFNIDTIEIGQPFYYTLDEPVDRATITEISVHGGTPRESIVQDVDMVRVTPYKVTSPQVSMSKFNLRQGDLTHEPAMRRRCEKGIAAMIEDDSWSLLEAGLLSNVDDADSFEDIDGINIDDRVMEYPTDNELDLGSEGGLTLEVFKKIADHFNRLGRQVRNIYIPSNRQSDLWDWMSIPAGYDDGSGVDADGVVPMALHEQIVRTGSVNNLFGYPVNLVPLNTLRGTANSDDGVYIWVNTGMACGEFRNIPAVTSTYSEEDAERIYFQQTRGLALFQLPPQKLNYARVKIEDATE